MFRREQLGAALRSLVLPLAIALILDAVFYTGYLASDDNGYLSIGYRVLRGEAMPVYVGSVRLGMSIPVIVLYWLADGRAHLIASAFALLHPVLVVLVYCIGHLSHGPTVARMAAVLTAICPFMYVFAGAILPDLLMSSGIALSLIAVMLAVSRRGLLWPALAGIALGLAYSVKETALVMAVPALASLLLALRSNIRAAAASAAAFLGGLLAAMLLETLGLRLSTGEWVTHLGMLAAADTQQHLAETAVTQGLGPWSRFNTTFLELKLIGPLWIWMLVLGSIAYGWVKDRSWPVWLFAVWSFAYLTWGTTSLSSYNPPPIQPRYYSMVFVPASVVIARVLVAVARPIASARVRAWSFAALIAALSFGELARNRLRAGDIYGAWMARGVELAYRSASLGRPDLKVVLSPEYGWSLDGMFLEHAPPNLVSLHEWDRARCPEPPFLYVELGRRFEEAKLSKLVGRPLSISTYDVIYPERRLERLWDGILGFFLVGPRPPRGTWSWHMRETLVLLVEAGEAEGGARPILDSAPLYPDHPLRVRRTPSGHVISWPRSMEPAGVQLFDQRELDVPPTHESSRLAGGDPRLCVEVDYDALGSAVRIRAELHAYGAGGEHLRSGGEQVELEESASATASLEVRGARPIRSFRVHFELTSKAPGALLIAPPRIVPCHE
jgi:hypothetical protein